MQLCTHDLVQRLGLHPVQQLGIEPVLLNRLMSRLLSCKLDAPADF